LHLDRDGVDVDDGRAEHRCDAERNELLLRLARQWVRKRAEHVLGRLDQQDARLACVDRAVLASQRVPELGDLPRHLDAGWTGSDDDERQPRLARRLVCLRLRRFEREQDAVAQVERARE